LEAFHIFNFVHFFFRFSEIFGKWIISAIGDPHSKKIQNFGSLIFRRQNPLKNKNSAKINNLEK
jgi:hypothetical protein